MGLCWCGTHWSQYDVHAAYERWVHGSGKKVKRGPYLPPTPFLCTYTFLWITVFISLIVYLSLFFYALEPLQHITQGGGGELRKPQKHIDTKTVGQVNWAGKRWAGLWLIAKQYWHRLTWVQIWAWKGPSVAEIQGSARCYMLAERGMCDGVASFIAYAAHCLSKPMHLPRAPFLSTIQCYNWCVS